MKKQIFKVKNSLWELDNDFIGLKDQEMKDRQVKNKKEIKELFFKLIIVSIDDRDRFGQKEMKMKRPIKHTW